MDTKRKMLFLDGAAAPPPVKRLRGEAPPPSSPGWRLMRRVVLIVLFRRRLDRSRRDRSAAADGDATALRVARVVREEVRRGLEPIFRGYRLLVDKLERIEERFESLAHKVDQITPLRSSLKNQQCLMHEANMEGTSAEGLTENKGQGIITSVRLRFLHEMKPSIYHDNEIKAENNEAITIGIFDGEQMIESGPLSKTRVEILALEGNFPYDAMDNWTSEEFNQYIAVSRDGKGNVLAGKCSPRLNNGVAILSNIKFREGSCKAHDGMFILGARVCEGAITGPRVQEAVMKPVVVQDRRNKSNEKSHPPKPDERVDRLEMIAGTYCNRLEENHIITVQDFSRALNKDPDNLAKILRIKKGGKSWEKMVEHARECSLEGKHELKSYLCAERNVVLFFNCVHFLVGAAFGEHYTASDNFDQAQQFKVDKLKKSAYEQLDALQFDYRMEGDFPVPNPMNANAGAGPSVFMSSASQQNHSGHHAAYQDANNYPISFSIPDHHNTHNLQDQSTEPLGQQQITPVSLNDWSLDPLGEDLTGGLSTGAEDEEVELYLNPELFTVEPGFDQVQTQMQNIMPSNEIFHGGLTSHRGNIPLAPQHQMFHGPAQVSMLSQRQAALPGNGLSDASTSGQNNLPPHQSF